MNLKRNTHWKLAIAAAAALPLLSALPATAQYPSNNDGRARDANNRVGSNGYNDGGGVTRTPAVSPNNVVYGNVTRGAGFRGPVGSTDPRAFRAGPAGLADNNSDAFIANSSGAAVRGAPNLNSTYSPQPFYGQSRGVAPPPGVVTLGTPGAYVEPTQSQAAEFINNSYNSSPWAYTQPFTSGELSATRGLGTTVLPNATAGRNDNRAFLLSPLSGVYEAAPNALTGASGTQPDFYVGRDGSVVRSGDRFANPQAIEQIRSELQGLSQQPNGQGVNGQNGANGANPNAPLPNGALQTTVSPNAATPNGPRRPGQLDRPLPQPLETPNNAPLQSGELNSGVQGGQPLGDAVNTGQSLRRQVPLPPAAQQSSQYNELEQRLKRYRTEDEQSDQAANEAMRMVAPRGTGTPGAAGAPGVAPQPGGAAPGGSARPAAPRAVVPGKPVDVKSFAAGVQSPTLAQVLKSAEDLMKQGKFSAALEQYDSAERAAPNNPLIGLGQATAELGAGSYRSAEAHLRQSFARDPALLMGRYDLRSLIGSDRVQVLGKDLSELSKANPQEATAPFLLGYIDYSTGNNTDAAAWLNVAEQRSGRADPSIRAMRQYWGLGTAPAPASPATPAATPSLNK